jgi:glycosyltransferase involved in cell wall biosynthesis
MSQPLVSFGVVCYNTGKYVVSALDSIATQNYDNVEVFIVDDASTDNSVELIKDWLQNNNKQQWHFIVHSRNKGLHYGLNEILDLAQGKYISFIGDDVFTSQKTKEQVRMLEDAGAEYGVVYGDMSYIDEAGNDIKGVTWFEEKFHKDFEPPQGNIFHHIPYSLTFFVQASLYRLSLLKEKNFRFDDKYICEDWHLNLFVTRHSKATGSKEVYCKYRYRNDSVTATNWTDEKMHKVLLSQYDMLRFFFKHPLNNEEDNAALYKKLHALSLQLYSSEKTKKTTKTRIAFDIFRIQPTIKNLAKFASLLVFGNLDIAKKIGK